MSRGMNKAILIGNVGSDPEMRYSPGGAGFLGFRLATADVKKVGDRWEDETDWHSVTVVGKRAESLSKVLEKGRLVSVEGKIKYRSWEDKEGFKRYATDIIAFDVTLLGPANGARRSSSGDSHSGDNGARGRDDTPDFAGGEDDIPF